MKQKRRNYADNIPIFIHHETDEKSQTGGEKKQKYVSYCIKQAEKYNSDVFLFGDEHNKSYADNWLKASDYLDEKWDRFLSVFSNYSDYPDTWAKGIFKRFFIFENYMRQREIHGCIVLDSDVLVFLDFAKSGIFHGVDVAMEIPKNQDFDFLEHGNGLRMVACAGIAYFTFEALKNFTDYCIEEYAKGFEAAFKDKITVHKDYHLPGGICEMTLLYLWQKNREDVFQFRNLLLPYRNMICDNGMQESGLYEENQVRMYRWLGIKKFYVQGGFCRFTGTDNSLITAYAMHFGGWSKIYIRDIYRFHRIGIYSIYSRGYVLLKSRAYKVYCSLRSLWR